MNAIVKDLDNLLMELFGQLQVNELHLDAHTISFKLNCDVSELRETLSSLGIPRKSEAGQYLMPRSSDGGWVLHTKFGRPYIFLKEQWLEIMAQQAGESAPLPPDSMKQPALLTYRQVKEYLTELADLVPDVDEQCEQYAMSYSPEHLRGQFKGDVSCPETLTVQFKIKGKRVYLKVESFKEGVRYEM